MTVWVANLDLGGNGPRVAIKDTIDIAGVPSKAEGAEDLMWALINTPEFWFKD